MFSSEGAIMIMIMIMDDYPWITHLQRLHRLYLPVLTSALCSFSLCLFRALFCVLLDCNCLLQAAKTAKQR
jgi:hypothetical protein